MPRYDYQCGSCGHLFEDYAAHDDYTAKECPHECGPKSTRLPSLPAPARGNFGTVSRRPTKASTAIRDEKLKQEIKDKEGT